MRTLRLVCLIQLAGICGLLRCMMLCERTVSEIVKGDNSLYLCLFFQAEDGIRDLIVTGVQTCALPISGRCASAKRPSVRSPSMDGAATCGSSEERRVGKECRSRWSPYHEKTKKTH